MFITGGSREFLGVGRGPEGRRGERSLAAAARELGGGIGWLVIVESRLALLLVRVQAMQSTMLVLEFCEAQSILQTERNLFRGASRVSSQHNRNRMNRNHWKRSDCRHV